MLKIRMQRTGRTNDPSFRVVVAEHTSSPKTGKFVEKVGTYNPKSKQRSLNAERIKYWLSVGAKASPTIHNMLISQGVIEGKKINILPKYKEPTEAAPTTAEVTLETPAEPAEASAEEKKEETPAEKVEAPQA